MRARSRGSRRSSASFISQYGLTCVTLFLFILVRFHFFFYFTFNVTFW
eukprot:UN16384